MHAPELASLRPVCVPAPSSALRLAVAPVRRISCGARRGTGNQNKAPPRRHGAAGVRRGRARSGRAHVSVRYGCTVSRSQGHRPTDDRTDTQTDTTDTRQTSDARDGAPRANEVACALCVSVCPPRARRIRHRFCPAGPMRDGRWLGMAPRGARRSPRSGRPRRGDDVSEHELILMA